ncbi:MAG: flavodoxin family protein [Promethearchaeota archaeon]|nr:MAG: flavodoxin family protein [Candidatus Lokiarchaeota archaeon]
MKVLAFNGSPRKKWNTATLLEKALEGAVSQGAETELIHLYDLNFKGCRSCFSCKLRGGKSYGRCALKDDLTPFLKKIEAVDAIILGSPIYYTTVTGVMKSFMERLLFPYNQYSDPYRSLFPRKIKTGFVYTMNQTKEEAKVTGIVQHCRINEILLKFTFGFSESLLSHDTYQFEDYSKVVAERFDVDKKAQIRKEVFPKDCEKAFEMGVKFAKLS